MPRDQWKFVTNDESLTGERPLEEQALHEEHFPPTTPAEDPGRADVTLGPDDDRAPPVYFDDEESDDPVEEETRERAEDSLDLEGMLEEQHYAFPDADE